MTTFAPIRVTFRLDGTGLYYDYHEPLMLDGVLAYACARHHVSGEAPARDEEPADIPIPVARWERGGTWGWCASALMPDGATAESTIRWRKRLREDRVTLAKGSPNRVMGLYRDWDMPLPLVLCRAMVGYCVGDRRRVRDAAKSIRWLGKKRAHGRGRVVGLEVDRVDEDWSIERDGLAQRWLPTPDGARLVRPRPPYWSIVGRVPSCEVGDPVASDDPVRT